MCALCGIVGDSDCWTDATPRTGVYTRRDTPQARRAEAARRMKLLNALLAPLGMKVRDWQGKIILETLTGKSEVLNRLSHVWIDAEMLTGRDMDPLDPDWLAKIEAAALPVIRGGRA